MFSPSLISMIFHSFDPPPGAVGATYSTMADVVDALQSHLTATPAPSTWPTLPIVGRTTRVDINLPYWFQNAVQGDGEGPGALYFWGRVSIDVLIKYLAAHYSIDAGREYIDLGTPLRELGSGSQFDRDCANYLSQTAASPSQATVGAAIIDLAENSNSPPDDYNGHLRHAVGNFPGNYQLSEHAEKVLSVLLERLSPTGLLSNTTVSYAPVLPPAAMIHPGKSCFEQANVVEMLDAVKAMYYHVASDNLPAAINLSLGTHVGPHNGDSPFEEYIAEKLTEPCRRFAVVAAGNDGGRGLSGRRLLQPGERDFLSIQTGPRCKDLLVEFWWEEQVGAEVPVAVAGEEGGAAAGLSIEATVFEISPTGDRARQGVIAIGPGTAGTSLAWVPAGLGRGLAAHSLFSAKCRNNFSCIAFAISASRSTPPALHLRFALESLTELVVNAWIVVSELRPQSAFLEAGPEGTVTVPASDLSVLSVAGLEANGRVWDGSSRGPAAQYRRSRQPNESSPLMAHLAALGADFGTSFASPRACADALQSLADNTRRLNCNDAVDLMCETYSLTRANLYDWSPRTGFYKRTN